MKEFVEKLIERLEKEYEYQLKKADECEKKEAFEMISVSKSRRKNAQCFDTAIQVVNQLAEEYNNESVKGDLISRSLLLDCLSYYISHTDEKSGEHYAYERAKDLIENQPTAYNDGWIACEKELPPHSDDLLLIQCNGKPRNNIHLVNAFCLASYTEDGWILEMYPDWEDAEVVAWKNLGEPYQPKGE